MVKKKMLLHITLITLMLQVTSYYTASAIGVSNNRNAENVAIEIVKSMSNIDKLETKIALLEKNIVNNKKELEKVKQECAQSEQVFQKSCGLDYANNSAANILIVDEAKKEPMKTFTDELLLFDKENANRKDSINTFTTNLLLFSNDYFKKKELENFFSYNPFLLSKENLKEKKLKRKEEEQIFVNNLLSLSNEVLEEKELVKTFHANLFLFGNEILDIEKEKKTFIDDLLLFSKIRLKEKELERINLNNIQNSLYLNTNQLKQLTSSKVEENKKLKNSQKTIERFLNENSNIDKSIKQSSLDIINNYSLNISNSDIRNNIFSFATSFIGMPYKWGGAFINQSFDCSGLTQYVYNKFGISLPRVAEDQQQVGTDVSFSNAKTGDLVFFGRPAHHVGIYVGNGYMLHAPHTGDFIKISPINTPTNIKRIIND